MKKTEAVNEKWTAASRRQAELTGQLSDLTQQLSAARSAYETSVGDGRTEAELDAMDAQLYKADRERGRVEIRLKQVNAELDALAEERAVAEREDAIAELEAKFSEMEALIQSTPAILTTEFAGRWIAFCRECQTLRSRLGLKTTEFPDHLMIKYYQATFWPLFPRYVTKPPGAYVGKSFLQIFREHRERFVGTESELSRLSA
jgi:hypothetical protein